MRTRMYGGVGGEEPRGFPLSRLCRKCCAVPGIASGVRGEVRPTRVQNPASPLVFSPQPGKNGVRPLVRARLTPHMAVELNPLRE